MLHNAQTVTLNDARDYDAGVAFMRSYMATYGLRAGIAWLRLYRAAQGTGQEPKLAPQRIAGMADALLVRIQSEGSK